jgi:alpha-N-acetylglucosamine transferase
LTHIIKHNIIIVTNIVNIDPCLLCCRGQKLIMSCLQALLQKTSFVLNRALASVPNAVEYRDIRYDQTAAITRSTVNHAHKKPRCVYLIDKKSCTQWTRSCKLMYQSFMHTARTDKEAAISRMCSIRCTKSTCLLVQKNVSIT